jgi:hypothetical protein
MRFVFVSLASGVGMLYLLFEAVGYINNVLGFG